MTKNVLRIFLVCLSVFSVSIYANSSCPCPGPCCPALNKTTEDKPNTAAFLDMADYLYPWATQENTDRLVEEGLQKHRVKMADVKN